MRIFKSIQLFKVYPKHKIKQWMDKLDDSGFHKIEFPILIKDGHEIDIVWQLEDFASDPDLFYHSFDDTVGLIDSNGNYWTWKYDQEIKSNLPGTKTKELSVDELREVILYYFKDTKLEIEITEKTKSITSIFGLLDCVADRI